MYLQTLTASATVSILCQNLHCYNFYHLAIIFYSKYNLLIFFGHTICMYMKDNVNERLKRNTEKKSIKTWAVVFSLVLALETILISYWELSIHSLLYAISIPSANRKKCYYFLKISCFFKDGSWYLKGGRLQMKPWHCKTHS